MRSCVGPLSPRFLVFTAELALAGPIKAPFRSLFVIGDLAPDEAREFFFSVLLPSNKHPDGASEAWGRVYKVCGGNPGLLLKCVGEAAAYNSWELGACLHASGCGVAALRLCCAHSQAVTQLCEQQ